MLMAEYCADFAQDHAELGAALNGFSLNESGQLSTAIERTGQAIDTTYMSTSRLVRPHLLFHVFFAHAQGAIVARARAELGRTVA